MNMAKLFLATILLLLFHCPLTTALAEDSPPLIDFSSNTEEKITLFSNYLDVFGSEFERAARSMNYYYDWCCNDMKNGPGKERSVNAIYSVNEDVPKVPELSPAVLSDPGVTKLQLDFQVLVSSFETVVPIINEAHGYYDSEAYKIDDFEEGRELHKRLHPALKQYKTAYLSTAKLVVANLDGYSAAVLNNYLKVGDDWGFAVKSASLAMTKLIMSTRIGIKPTKQDTKDVVRALIECRRVLMKQNADIGKDQCSGDGRKDIKWGFFTYQHWLLDDCAKNDSRRCRPVEWWSFK